MSDPRTVRAALDRVESGQVDGEVFAAIVSGAEAFAALTQEWVFESPQTGLVYATQNVLLAETLLAARPDALLVERLAPPLPSPSSTDQAGA